MLERAGFTPFADVKSETVKIREPYPGQFVEGSLVGLNTKALEGLCAFCGIKELTIKATNDGAVSPLPVVDFRFGRFSRYAIEVRDGRPSIPTYQTAVDLIVPTLNVPIPGRKMTGTITLNNREITQRVNQEGAQEGVFSATAWAKQLDQGIWGGVYDLGAANLTGLRTQAQKNWFLCRALAVMTIVSFLDNYQKASFISIMMLLNLASYLVDRRQFTEGYRASLFFGPQLDRLAVFWLASKTTTLVAPTAKPKIP